MEIVVEHHGMIGACPTDVWWPSWEHPGEWGWPSLRGWMTPLVIEGDHLDHGWPSLERWVISLWMLKSFDLCHPSLNPLPGWHRIWTAPKHLLTPRMCLTLFLLTPLFMDSQDSINATLVNHYLVFPILTSWLSSKTFPPPHTLLFQLQPIKFYWFICIAWSDTQTQVLIELFIKYSISVNTFNPSLPIIERQELPALHKIRFGAFFRF